MTIAQASPNRQPMRTVVRFLAIAMMALPLAALAGEHPPVPGLNSPSPLAGRVWSPSERRLISPEALVERMLEAGIVGLGETHDNPDHHALQAWAVRRLVAAGRRPVVAFEMMDADQQAALDAGLGDLDGLGRALHWEKRGWPDWSLYRPIAQAALDGGGALVAANLPTSTTREIAKGQENPDIRDRFGLDDPLPAPISAAMATEIRDGHCNLLPETAVPAMVRVQRARDAALAEAVANQATRPEVGPVVLVAGSGHVRADRGAPARLRLLVPGVRVFTLAFLEAGDGESDPAAAARFRDGGTPFDAVWFTGKVEREDPCAQMERHMRAKAK
ncbi:hypothetical protein A6A04_18580 [Paramagnetospirillum marisnigri]|uniref:Haem-binding uptake Tiki superfamily ChaN domain-containing protein n=1 Tax=Paramagnetospirillum marisnigri TaxID=1285242 RepID=A0A178MM76_9PROT|nr:ChaN family lipoprotein [Paramagnetospirillum marisnigri]OAN49852.1 hypothetical protein A6A04_18580 [Paramagnetospirillum marisnigri]